MTYELSTLALTGVGGHTSEAPRPKLRKVDIGAKHLGLNWGR